MTVLLTAKISIVLALVMWPMMNYDDGGGHIRVTPCYKHGYCRR